MILSGFSNRLWSGRMDTGTMMKDHSFEVLEALVKHKFDIGKKISRLIFLEKQ